MNIFFITLITGVIIAVIDILPMIKMKLDKSAILSAFVFYLMMPFVIYNTNLWGMPWWLSGGVITLLLAMPVIILVAKDGLKAAIPIAMMSVVLGTLIGVIGRFVLKVM